MLKNYTNLYGENVAIIQENCVKHVISFKGSPRCCEFLALR